MVKIKNRPIGYLFFYGLTIGLILSVIFAGGTVQHNTILNTDVQDNFAITHGPYLQLITENSVIIVWHTNRNSVSTVEYGLDQTAIQSNQGLIDTNSKRQQIKIVRLQLGTTCKNRIVSREFKGYTQQHLVTFGETAISDDFSFTTLDRKNNDFFASFLISTSARAIRSI